MSASTDQHVEAGWYIEEQKPVYFDFNATTPLAPEVKASIIESLELWANPSSNNVHAHSAADAIKIARKQLADLLHVSPAEVFFTSGGTEANNWAIHSAIHEFQRIHPNEKPHIITSTIEHQSVLRAIRELESNKTIDATIVGVDPNSGIVLLEEIAAALRPQTCLVTIMLANNETGVIQPIAEIADIVRKASSKFDRKILLHCDAIQAIGKIDVSLDALKVDTISVAGHKFHGPRNGALIIRSVLTVPLHPFLFGCGQEKGFRSGTENTPMIIGLGKAAELAAQRHSEKLLELRQLFESRLKESLKDDVKINFESSPRLPNTSSVSFPKYPGTSADFLSKCRSFIASIGAAGHSTEKKASQVLLNSGLSEHDALRTIRFSFGRTTTVNEIERVAKEVKAINVLAKSGGSLMAAIGKGPVVGF